MVETTAYNLEALDLHVIANASINKSEEETGKVRSLGLLRGLCRHVGMS